MQKTFGQKIKALRKDAELTQVQMLEQLNSTYDRSISESMLSKWERDIEEPQKFSDAAAIALFFGVTTDYLLGISEAKYPVPEIDSVKQVPIIGTIAAGTPILAEQNIIGHKWVKGSCQVDFCLAVKGDSMIGARILDGDIVCIRRQPEVETGEIAVVIIDGDEATLKRVIRTGGVMILRAENPAYQDIIFTKRDAKDIKIIGKAVFFESEVK